MKRIALFSHGGFDLSGEGVYIPFLAGLVERLGRTYDVSIYAPGNGPANRDPLFPGQVRLVPLHVTSASPLFLKTAALWRAATIDHRRQPFDCVHGIWAIPSGAIAVAFGKKQRIPSAVSLHGSETASIPEIGYGNMRGEPYRSVTRWTCRRAGALFCLSTHQRESLRMWGITRNDVVVIPPGAEPKFLVAMPRPCPTSGTLNILHVANLTEVKDQETLLRAFVTISRSRESRLRIVGADYLQGRIQRRAGELGIASRVEFTGFVPHDAMPRQYSWAHILLQTSLHEAGGVAVAEAGAGRVVVCGTSTGIVADFAERCAVTAAPGDDAGLARAVLDLLSDPERFMRIQECAYRWAAENSVDTSARLIAETYERLPA